MDEEVWREVPRYPRYLVSNLGGVRSKDIVSSHWRGGTRVHKGVIFTPSPSTPGYLIVCLYYQPMRRRTVTVHRIVAEAFLPKVEGKNYVNHRNGNKKDNRASNLEWCTPSENIQHARDITGRLRLGSRCTQSKLTEQDVENIKNQLSSGATGRSIALKYGVTPAAISLIKRGVNWKRRSPPSSTRSSKQRKE